MPASDCYLVVDALRATTTIAALFANGLRRLHVVADIAAARKQREHEGMLLFGEQGGLKPEGFDYGNSPAEAASLDVRDGEATLMTSNGTVALCAVAGRGVTVSASLANASAVVAFARGHSRVTVVCAGNGGARRFSLEDFAVAAALVRGLIVDAPAAERGDAASLAARLAAPESLISTSEHAAITRNLGFAADIEFAQQRDIAPCVPLVVQHGDGWADLENRR